MNIKNIAYCQIRPDTIDDGCDLAGKASIPSSGPFTIKEGTMTDPAHVPTRFALTGLDTYAIMVLLAHDATAIYSQFKHQSPKGNPTIPKENLNITAYINNKIFKVLHQLRSKDNIIFDSDDCYFGLILQAKEGLGPICVGDIVVVLKGTSNFQEFISDAASIVMTDDGNTPGDVALGFWKMYRHLKVADLYNNKPFDQEHAAETIGRMYGSKNIFVVGHSLGAALSTYLAYDLINPKMGAPAKNIFPYMFASPRTGNHSHVRNYKEKVPFYNLTNYEHDVVPKLPFKSEGFCTLDGEGPHQNVHSLKAGHRSVFSGILSELKNHSSVLYAQLLDPNNPEASRMSI